MKIYSELTYGNEEHCSIASIDGMQERTIVINGFSKTYSMTGWRLGYALGPEACYFSDDKASSICNYERAYKLSVRCHRSVKIRR